MILPSGNPKKKSYKFRQVITSKKNISLQYLMKYLSFFRKKEMSVNHHYKIIIRNVTTLDHENPVLFLKFKISLVLSYISIAHKCARTTATLERNGFCELVVKLYRTILAVSPSDSHLPFLQPFFETHPVEKIVERVWLRWLRIVVDKKYGHVAYHWGVVNRNGRTHLKWYLGVGVWMRWSNKKYLKKWACK